MRCTPRSAWVPPDEKDPKTNDLSRLAKEYAPSKRLYWKGESEGRRLGGERARSDIVKNRPGLVMGCASVAKETAQIHASRHTQALR